MVCPTALLRLWALREKQGKCCTAISCSAVLTMGHLEVPRQAQSSTQPTQDDMQPQQAERRGLPCPLWVGEWNKPSPELPNQRQRIHNYSRTLTLKNDYNVYFVHIYEEPKNISLHKKARSSIIDCSTSTITYQFWRGKLDLSREIKNPALLCTSKPDPRWNLAYKVYWSHSQ